MNGYLVAQLNDVVQILEPGPLYGTYGKVIDQRNDIKASPITARVCTVLSDGGATIEVSADRLEVLK